MCKTLKWPYIKSCYLGNTVQKRDPYWAELEENTVSLFSTEPWDPRVCLMWHEFASRPLS